MRKRYLFSMLITGCLMIGLGVGHLLPRPSKLKAGWFLPTAILTEGNKYYIPKPPFQEVRSPFCESHGGDFYDLYILNASRLKLNEWCYVVVYEDIILEVYDLKPPWITPEIIHDATTHLFRSSASSPAEKT